MQEEFESATVPTYFQQFFEAKKQIDASLGILLENFLPEIDLSKYDDGEKDRIFIVLIEKKDVIEELKEKTANNNNIWVLNLYEMCGFFSLENKIKLLLSCIKAII